MSFLTKNLIKNAKYIRINNSSFLAACMYSSSIQQEGLLKVGDKTSIRKSFTPKEVESFALISGDTNPVHLDENFAKTTRFGKPIVHGVLSVGLLSGILGTKLPGKGTVVLSYSVEYPAPLYVNETVTAEVEITEIKGRKVVCEMKCFTNDNRVVTKGVCTVFVPRDRVRKLVIQ